MNRPIQWINVPPNQNQIFVLYMCNLNLYCKFEYFTVFSHSREGKTTIIEIDQLRAEWV